MNAGPPFHLHRAIWVLLLAVILSACAPGSVPVAAVQPTPRPTAVAVAPSLSPPTAAPPLPTSLATVTPAPTAALSSTVDGWAVLAVKENYADIGWPAELNLESGFLNLYQLHSLLLYMGWSEDHIMELRDTLDQEHIEASLQWLAEHADENDVVLFYIGAHGSYIRDEIHWADFFAQDWARIRSQKRVLIVDACHAAEFTAAVASDSSPHLSIAAVDAPELGWFGVWKEGLPIIGFVFGHFWANAFVDPTADLDGNGLVSVQEAASRADVQQRDYMHQVIWTKPEFSKYAVQDPAYPHVVVDDTMEEPVYLDLRP